MKRILILLRYLITSMKGRISTIVNYYGLLTNTIRMNSRTQWWLDLMNIQCFYWSEGSIRMRIQWIWTSSYKYCNSDEHIG